MSYDMVKHLVVKDWRFNAWPIAFYFTIGLLGLATVRFGASDGAFYIGSTVLLAALIAVGIHQIMMTVVLERSEGNLPFVMSLPISAKEYTSAKIIASVSAFLLPWLTLVAATLWLILSTDGMPNGLLPFAILLLVEIVVAYCIMLCVAIVSESEGWTILAIVLCNLGFNFWLYSLSHIPAIEQHMEGPVAVWNQTAVSILIFEVLAIVLILAITFALQARKRDFL